MDLLHGLFEESKDPQEYSKAYIENLISLLKSLDHAAIAAIAGKFKKIRKDRGCIYFAGNGGSASTCSHYVNDFHAGSLRHGGGGYRLVDLTSNIASVTALANDVGYENVFCRQLEDVIESRDALVVISASGNSANLIKAAEFAKSRGAATIGILGFDGGQLKSRCDISLVVNTPQGQYGPVEDIHLIINHIISTYLTFKNRVDGKQLRS
jgi:D-sedoheptulose 7-phosphate isomerase